MNYERFLAIGNATKDAQSRKAKEGERTFTTFSLAVNKGQEKANFYEVVIFDATAESAADLIKKGDTIFVDGTLNVRPYRTKKGEPRTSIQVQAEQWRKLKP